MVYNEERALTTTVNNIEHIESTSYNGIGVIKVFFRQGTSVDAGVAQITAVSQTVLRAMPPGTTPPLVIQYNASTVPILQYGISGKGMSEQEIFDVERQPDPRRPHHGAGRRHPVAVWRQAAARLGRSRFEGAAGAEPLSRGCRQRRQRPEPGASERHGEDRPDGIRHQSEYQPANVRSIERSADQDGQRRGHPHARCGPGPRRLSTAAEHRPPGRRAQHVDQHPQDRLGLDAHRWPVASSRRWRQSSRPCPTNWW